MKPRSRPLPFALAIALSGFACSDTSAETPRGSARTAPPAARTNTGAAMEPTPAPTPPVDQERARKATAVLRVRFLSFLGGDKYAWDRVEVLAVLKKPSGEEVPSPLEVAHYDTERGVPAGESTIYLERYGEPPSTRWQLLGGGAGEGVSHVSP